MVQQRDWVHVVACPTVIEHGVSEKAKGRSRIVLFVDPLSSPSPLSSFLFRILGWRGWTHVNFILFQRLVIRWEQKRGERESDTRRSFREPNSSLFSICVSFSLFLLLSIVRTSEQRFNLLWSFFALFRWSQEEGKESRNQEFAEASGKDRDRKDKERLREEGKD